MVRGPFVFISAGRTARTSCFPFLCRSVAVCSYNFAYATPVGIKTPASLPCLSLEAGKCPWPFPGSTTFAFLFFPLRANERAGVKNNIIFSAEELPLLSLSPRHHFLLLTTASFLIMISRCPASRWTVIGMLPPPPSSRQTFPSHYLLPRRRLCFKGFGLWRKSHPLPTFFFWALWRLFFSPFFTRSLLERFLTPL